MLAPPVGVREIGCVSSASLPAHRVADGKLHPRTVHRADFELREQPPIVLHAHKEIQATTGVSIAAESQEIQRRACACVHVPRALRWEMVGELEIERDERSVVADPDFDIRSKPQAVDERRRLDVAAKIELIGIGGYAGPSTDGLRMGGDCEG